MPRLALHLIERLYEIDPPANPLSAFSLGLNVGIDGLRLNARARLRFHVVFNPGRWFSFAGYELARRMAWRPRPVTQDPVPVFLPNQPTPFHHEPARDLLDRYGATCQFGETSVQFIEPVQGTYTASHRLFARFATTRSGSMDDSALVLGLSFLMHNDCDLQLLTAPGRFAGHLTLR